MTSQAHTTLNRGGFLTLAGTVAGVTGNVAQVEVKTLAAHVLRSYVLKPIDGQAPIHGGHWTAALPRGMWMRVKART